MMTRNSRKHGMYSCCKKLYFNYVYHKSYIKSRYIEYLENNKIHFCTESNDTIKDRHFTDELER